MEIVKVNWSGGKDSTTAVMKHIEAGHKVIAVCYIPMFTEKIPLILKSHYEFILNTAQYFRSLGADVYFVSGITYYDFVKRRSTRGKYKGRAFGFPPFITGMCNFKKESKIKSLNAIDVGIYDYEDIGIAFDEEKRKSCLNSTKRSILNELKINEYKAFDFCNRLGLLSPIYQTTSRDGCALCPQANEQTRKAWFNDYPEAVPLVIELQEFVKCERPEQTPLRNQKWFIE